MIENIVEDEVLVMLREKRKRLQSEINEIEKILKSKEVRAFVEIQKKQSSE